MKIRAGDSVVIISGKDKGKTGTVLRTLPGKNRVVVGGINMRVKHVKATPQRPGQRIEFEGSLHVSNVMIVDPKTKKRTRIGAKVNDKGVKQRVARKSGEVITKTKAAAAKPTKTTAAKGAKKPDVTEEKVVAAPKADAGVPGRKPFWKRVANFGEEAIEGAEQAEGKGETAIPKSTPPMHRSSGRGN
jgi:large subunit ribosomal protein L24